MNNLSFSQRISARIAGPFYAFLYKTNQQRLLGFAIGGWLKNLPLLFSLLAFVMRWSFVWVIFGIVLAIIVRMLYWRARRVGYISFVSAGEQIDPKHVQDIKDNVKVFIFATGKFSVQEREYYVLERPAEYWRVQMGDHTFMVEHPPGRFLYQFIQRGSLEEVESGFLWFGREPKPALAVTFLSSWGTGAEEVNFQFYAPSKNSSSAKFRRKIYLTFLKDADKEAMWQSLMRDANQVVAKKV